MENPSDPGSGDADAREVPTGATPSSASRRVIRDATDLNATSIEQEKGALDAAILSSMGELDYVFKLIAAMMDEARIAPAPDADDLMDRAHRLHQALTREVKAITAQRRELQGAPAPPPTGGFTEGMTWIPDRPGFRPPAPPPGFAWSAEISDSYDVTVYTLCRAQEISAAVRAEDARIIADWRRRLAARRASPVSPSPSG